MPTNHLSVSIAHRANPETQALSNSSNKTPISVGLSEQGLKKTVQAREVNMSLATKELLPPKSAVGFLLMDSNLNLISSNVEAAQILSYPDKVANLGLVTERILSTLMSQELLGESPFVPIASSLPTFQPHATRARNVGVSVARLEQQGDCESDERQPQHSEGHPTNDHGQDACFVPVGSYEKNHHDATAVTTQSSFQFFLHCWAPE